jgi:enoyl-CoA hydratase
MGGGIGLSAHARHRIVTEKSQLAMPETTIGLIPDVGGTWLLSRLRPGLGAYIGLSGHRMNGSDAIQTGFAQSYVPTEAIASLIRELSEPGDRSVDDIVEAFETPVPLSPLMADAEKIETWFGGDRMELILERLSETTDPMAQRIKADLAVRSPLALKATLAAVRRARSLRTLEEALAIEYRLCTALFHRGEFIEGVRALLVDKDKAPRWNPPTLAEVGDDLVAGLFARSGLVEDFELVPQAGAQME